jgi:ribosomal-protein-alanine N-acetyltransferase
MAGFLIAQIAADEAEILSIGVAPEWQRRGIARYMVEGLVRAARRAEVRRLFLEVAVTNTAANRLYQSLGFEAVGRRKGYYQRPGADPVDAVVLALAL